MVTKKVVACEILLVLSILCAAVGALTILIGFIQGRPGAAVANWETGSTKFKIRVTAYEEQHIGIGVSGTYYRFECALADTDIWNEVLVFKHDDSIGIPRDQVRFVGDDVAYLFIGWMYAVTSDGGKTWSVWRADKDLPGWQCCNYGLIRDVVLNKEGTGTMFLKPISGRRGEVPELRTRDFGRTWTEPVS